MSVSCLPRADLLPTAPIPQACGSWAKTKAAYRFFDNASVNPPDLLAAHTQATLVRMDGQLHALTAAWQRFGHGHCG